jgi:hypothetical protein
MNDPTKTVGPPLTPLPARKISRVLENVLDNADAVIDGNWPPANRATLSLTPKPLRIPFQQKLCVKVDNVHMGPGLFGCFGHLTTPLHRVDSPVRSTPPLARRSIETPLKM